MAVLKPRSRVVYFRVSDEEYQRYETLCRTAGARSISDLIRSAMDQLVDNRKLTDSPPFARKLDELERALGELNGRLKALSRKPSKSAPGSVREPKRTD